MVQPCMISGLICGYTAFDFSNFTCLCKQKSELLCLVHEGCLDPKEPSIGFGFTTNPVNKEWCKLAIPCCSLGLKTPERLCAGAGRALCLKSAQSLPFDERYLKGAVCALYGIQCLPKFSCCGPAGTECPSLGRPLTEYQSPPAKEDMERGAVNIDMPKYRDKNNIV